MQSRKQLSQIFYFLFLSFIGCINTPLRAMKKKKIIVGKFSPYITIHNSQQQTKILQYCCNMKQPFIVKHKEHHRKEIDETIFFLLW